MRHENNPGEHPAYKEFAQPHVKRMLLLTSGFLLGTLILFSCLKMPFVLPFTTGLSLLIFFIRIVRIRKKWNNTLPEQKNLPRFEKAASIRAQILMILVFTGCTFISGYFLFKRRELAHNNAVTIGTVRKFNFDEEYSALIDYTVNGNYYTLEIPAAKNNGIYSYATGETAKIGDTLQIRYSVTDPSNSEVTGRKPFHTKP